MKEKIINYPIFKDDVLITASNSILKKKIEDILTRGLLDTDLSVIVEERLANENPYYGEWISRDSVITLYINNSFILNHYSKNTEAYNNFIKQLAIFLKPISDLASQLLNAKQNAHKNSLNVLSVFYKTHNNYKFQFLFDLTNDEDQFLLSFHLLLDTIVNYNKRGLAEFKAAIKKSFSYRNKIKYFLFTDGNWKVLDPLKEVCNDINNEYRLNKDNRIKKPLIILNRDNIRKHFVFDSNWVLSFDGLETLMIRPNDVSLYSNISDQQRLKAQEFYSKTIVPRHKKYYGNAPDEETQKEYFDYFELIITSLIFAYTAIEAFANICIPEYYEYSIEKDGVKTIYSKKAIELKFSLRDKFKIILAELFNTPDPTKEKWWSTFILLEDLRNELIHTKQSKSEERYSKLLAKNVFNTICVHKDIINYYGYYIVKSRKELLNEFPYNFGFDDFLPSLTTNKSYIDMERDIYNIPIRKRKRK